MITQIPIVGEQSQTRQAIILLFESVHEIRILFGLPRG